MDNIKPLMAGSLILTFFVGIGVGYYLPVQNEPQSTQTADPCPAEITSLDALNVTLADPEVLGLLGNKSIGTIAFSGGSYPERDTNYTQIVFRLQDPDPDDHMTASMIVVRINGSCMVSTAYETYPSYIPELVPET